MIKSAKMTSKILASPRRLTPLLLLLFVATEVASNPILTKQEDSNSDAIERPCTKYGPAVCANGGTCHDRVGHFYCECPPGKTGLLCQLDDGCYPSPCHPNATCDASPVDGHAICTCPRGFSGSDCSIDDDECAAGSPCEHNGVCVNEPGSFRCECARGFTGPRCEINIDECENNPCQNDASCLDDKGDYKCICLPGFAGRNCELNIDECASNPCENGATCKDLIHSFRCLCPPGYWGERCESNKSTPRLNDGLLEGPLLAPGNPWSNCSKSYLCWTLFNNGRCDQECNSAECLYDGNDCSHQVSPASPSSNTNNQIPRTCDEKTDLFCLKNYANGICDQECNSAECGWDGLDCENSPINENAIMPTINTQAQGSLLIRVEPAIEIGSNSDSQIELVRLLRKISMVTKTILKVQSYRNVEEGRGTEIELIADNRKCQSSCYNNTELMAKFLSALRQRTKDFDGNSTSGALKMTDVRSQQSSDLYGPNQQSNAIAWYVFVLAFMAFIVAASLMVISGKGHKGKEKAIVWFPEGFKPVLSTRNRDPTDRKPGSRGISTLQALGGNFFRGMKRNERNMTTDPNGLRSTDIDRCTATPNGGGIYHEPYDQYDQYGTTYNQTDSGSIVNNVDEPMTPAHMPLNPLNIEGPQGLTPLMVASMGKPYSKEPLGLVAYGTTGEVNGAVDSNVTDLLNRGAQLNLANKVTGETALHLAARHGRVDAARGLLERCDSQDVNAQDASGRTPLHTAIAADSLGVFELLIRCRNTDLNAQTHDGTTPLILATRVGTFSMLEELILNECEVTKSDVNGKTALHWAAATNNVDAIRRLLAVRETNKDAQDLAEETPLFLAAREGAKGAVELLLSHNANKDICDQMDRSPIEIARSRQHYDIVRLLEEHEPPTPRSITSMHHPSRANNVSMPATPSSLTNSLSPVSTSLMSPPTSHSMHHLSSPIKSSAPINFNQLQRPKKQQQQAPQVQQQNVKHVGQIPPPAYDDCQTFWSNTKGNGQNIVTINNNHVMEKTHALTEVYNVPGLKNYMTPSPDSPFSLESMASPPGVYNGQQYQNLNHPSLASQKQAGVFI